MVAEEFRLIARFFSGAASRNDVVLGVGDDCALLSPPTGQDLAVTTDTLIEGVHFPRDADAEGVAQRAMTANLSDLAAMGAKPRWLVLALTLPDADDVWLSRFSSRLREQAARYGCALVGGDTTRGPLAVSITMIGSVPSGLALRRDGAKPGDGIYVSGYLGDGAAGLAVIENRIMPLNASDAEYLRARYWQAEPRLEIGMGLRGLASAAIDISDGLLADLGHIANASGVGAVVEAEQLPLSPQLQRWRACGPEYTRQTMIWALSGGDDYELCITLADENREQMTSRLQHSGIKLTRIGQVTAGQGLRCVDQAGAEIRLADTGYSHF